ncbi:TatD family hydrolase [uncultured Parolsenella sp.]|uniref:TatD family hydrolase n=1 Tax=uncultured Parolsenella sp. TaxID=2083008 RepID=UPI0025EDC28E|nr:TatD family hydrolase [uncultured Parolsenella sp.]
MEQPAAVLADVEEDLSLADGELFHTRKGKAREWPRPLAPLADTHGHLTAFWGHDPARAIVRAALAGVRLLVVPLDALTDCVPGAGADPDMGAEPAAPARSAAELLAFVEDAISRARLLLPRYAEAGLAPREFPGHPMTAGVTRELPIDVRIVAGVHPYGAAEFDDACRGRMGELLTSARCVGVGEIGLDYTCDVPHDIQLACFREQLAIAAARDLPAELHIRDARDDEACEAHADALALLREVGVPPRGCGLHCYTGNAETLLPFAEIGCHVAFGGAVTFKRSDDIREAAAACPEDLLLSETDCPYMAPVPLRGEECEPGMVALSAACVADVREEAGLSARRETYDALWSNALAFFGLRGRCSNGPAC